MPLRPNCFCRNCNAPVIFGVDFCPACLINFPSDSLRNNETSNRTNKTKAYICQNCGTTFHLEESILIKDILCGTCLYNKYILHYTYKPSPEFHWSLGESSSQLPIMYYGIELEIEYVKKGELRELALAAQALPSVVFCKKDSSIRFGFEIVFHPGSFLWWKENLNYIEDRILSLRKDGFRSFDTNTCGIHIHMDKNKFNPTDIQKLHDFFRYNPGFVLMVSQRERKHLERWAGIYNPGDEKVYFKSINKQGGMERHVAINMNSARTIEIRIFRGTLNTKSFYKNIEFCDALYFFIKEVCTRDCTVENFLKFVIFHKEKYNNLFEFLKNRLMFVGDGV